MWLEDASAILHQGGPAGALGESAGAPRPGTADADGELSPEGRTAAKTTRMALAQQRLAVREYREAVRLRPRDAEMRQRLAAAVASLRQLQAALAGPKAQPLRRFLAHYNLSIRYWDLGKGKEALAEAERACQELRKAGLPCGCAEHNLVLMSQLQADHAAEQRRLQEAVRRSPEAVGPNYDLGVLLFDKRMLLRAEAQLRWARERARAASALQLVERERRRASPATGPPWVAAVAGEAWPEAEAKKARRMAGLLEEVEDDLEFIGGLRELWCVEEETGKAEELQATGVRDGARPHLLPCLRRRFSPDGELCERWWAEICSCADFGQRTAAKPSRKAASAKGRPLGW